MIGAIVGDVIGSVHEHAMTKSTDFQLFDPHCRFTDDTVLTVATAHWELPKDPCAITRRRAHEEERECSIRHQELG
jgi:ADP-ribosylglycohydrolase